MIGTPPTPPDRPSAGGGSTTARAPRPPRAH
ncbi:hypothetical protein FHU37_001068 [Allostreptomyces psammosilenae]|uniref:Uncharacterized protein n=1 Tax=Allostreptomyces psammosilenae TaxID=1892865 RepID=A0A852ZQU7_9ACTN|nr:hypothetical protein [Allostreptomyces psammosilenae]